MSFYDEPPEEWDDEFWQPDEPPDDSGSLVRHIMELYGVVDFQDWVVDLGAVQDPENIRGVRFSTLEEALIFLFQLGVLSFSEVTMIDDLYVPIVHDSPGVGNVA